jgi:hypothetical protein
VAVVRSEEEDGGGVLRGRGWQWLALRKRRTTASSKEEDGSGTLQGRWGRGQRRWRDSASA